jgi:hypothetical protein
MCIVYNDRGIMDGYIHIYIYIYIQDRWMYSTAYTHPVVWLGDVEVDDAPAEEGGAEHEQEVGEDGAEEGALDHLDLPLHQREQRDDELRRVAARRVQEAAHCMQKRICMHACVRPLL